MHRFLNGLIAVTVIVTMLAACGRTFQPDREPAPTGATLFDTTFGSSLQTQQAINAASNIAQTHFSSLFLTDEQIAASKALKANTKALTVDIRPVGGSHDVEAILVDRDCKSYHYEGTFSQQQLENYNVPMTLTGKTGDSRAQLICVPSQNAQGTNVCAHFLLAVTQGKGSVIGLMGRVSRNSNGYITVRTSIPEFVHANASSSSNNCSGSAGSDLEMMADLVSNQDSFLMDIARYVVDSAYYVAGFAWSAISGPVGGAWDFIKEKFGFGNSEDIEIEQAIDASIFENNCQVLDDVEFCSTDYEGDLQDSQLEIFVTAIRGEKSDQPGQDSGTDGLHTLEQYDPFTGEIIVTD